MFTTNHEPTCSWHNLASPGPSPHLNTLKTKLRKIHYFIQDIHSIGLRDSNASTNLLACGPTLRTFPLVSNMRDPSSYEPPCSQQLSSVSMENTTLPAHILTREYHNMKLPTHIITCSPPVVNLPAHDTIKHLLVQAQHHKHAKHKPKKHTTLCVIAWRCL